MAPQRWVAFDAVGTLIYPEPSVAQTYHRVAARYGSNLSEAEIRQRFRAAFRQSEAWDLQEHDVTLTHAEVLAVSEERERARWRWIVAEVLQDVEQADACFEELFEHFARPEAWRCFDDVEPALGCLRSEGMQLAIASNFDHRLHNVCDGLRELRDIKVRVISSLVGYRKPSRQFYQKLVDACGCKPRDLVMVGDDAVNDIRGAESAGLRAFLVRREDEDGAPGLLPLIDPLLGR